MQFSGNNDETFVKFDEKQWKDTVKQLDQVMTELEKFVESADEKKLSSMATTIANISTHNAYHVGQIVYLACGDKLLGKERIEIFGGGQSFIIDDFKLGEHYADGSRRTLKMPGKGHQEEVKAFLEAVRDGRPSPISLDSLALTSAGTFAMFSTMAVPNSEHFTSFAPSISRAKS